MGGGGAVTGGVLRKVVFVMGGVIFTILQPAYPSEQPHNPVRPLQASR